MKEIYTVIATPGLTSFSNHENHVLFSFSESPVKINFVCFSSRKVNFGINAEILGSAFLCQHET